MTVQGAASGVDALGGLSTATWLSLAALLVTTAGGIFMARLTGKQNKQVAEATARDPGWGLLAEAQREEIKMLRESRREDEERFGALEDRLDAAEKRARKLAVKVRDLTVRYVAAVQHIKEWRIWVVAQRTEPPVLPDSLVQDVDDPPEVEDEA